MTDRFSKGMARATTLTQAGKLAEATALIQSLLSPTPPAPLPDADLIEGTFARLDAGVPVPDPVPVNRTRPGKTPLAETLHRIAAGGMPGRGPVQPLTDRPTNVQMLRHGAGRDGRDYRLYVPQNRPPGLMPLIVMLHGCTQSPDDFAAGTGMDRLAEEHGCLIAYPAQPTGANANKCWNWFNPADQARGQGEPALIVGIVRDVLAAHPADPDRVFVAGLSAGGAAAAILGSAYPDVFAAVGVHSGLPVGAARDVPSAFAAMRTGVPGTAGPIRVPGIVFHGAADGTVHPGNGRSVVAQALRGQDRLTETTSTGQTAAGRGFRLTAHHAPDGRSMVEHWEIEGAGHAWAGGQRAGSYTDPAGPDASAEMVRFFLQHRRG